VSKLSTFLCCTVNWESESPHSLPSAPIPHIWWISVSKPNLALALVIAFYSRWDGRLDRPANEFRIGEAFASIQPLALKIQWAQGGDTAWKREFWFKRYSLSSSWELMPYKFAHNMKDFALSVKLCCHFPRPASPSFTAYLSKICISSNDI